MVDPCLEFDLMEMHKTSLQTGLSFLLQNISEGKTMKIIEERMKERESVRACVLERRK